MVNCHKEKLHKITISSKTGLTILIEFNSRVQSNLPCCSQNYSFFVQKKKKTELYVGYLEKRAFGENNFAFIT